MRGHVGGCPRGGSKGKKSSRHRTPPSLALPSPIFLMDRSPHLHAPALLLQQRHDGRHAVQVALLQQLLQEVAQLAHAQVGALGLLQPESRDRTGSCRGETPI
jgi:hypothetical protein